MTKIDLIKKIEEKRNSKVIAYLTSDRPGPLNARIAGDIIPIISQQLRKIGKVLTCFFSVRVATLWFHGD